MQSCRSARLNNSSESLKVLVNNAKRLICNDTFTGKNNMDADQNTLNQNNQTFSTSSNRSFFANQPSRDLKRFLEEVGTDPKEARYWLRHFQELEMKTDEPFAVIEIAPAVFQNKDMLGQLVSCLSFLHRSGMETVLVHGVDQMTSQSEDTDSYVLNRQRKQQLMDDNVKLVDMLENSGVQTRPFLCSSHMISTSTTSGITGYEGSIEHIDTEPLKWCLRSGHIPILTAVGENEYGQVVCTDPKGTALKVASLLKPTKIIFLNNTGGFTDDTGQVIDCIDILGDMSPILKQSWIDEPSSSLVKSISHFLLGMPRYTSAVITSANSLIRELFTHCGSGTLFQSSEPINVYHSLNDVDVDKLTQLLTKSFDKTLNADFFLTLSKRLHTLYVTESYTAAAILTAPVETHGVPYLDKFTISRESQGLGTSDNLWKKIKTDCAQLCWRSRETNRINPWYFVRSGGSWHDGEWTVFWYGVHDSQVTQKIIEYTTSLPSSFDPIAPHDEIKSKKVFSTNSYHKYL